MAEANGNRCQPIHGLLMTNSPLAKQINSKHRYGFCRDARVGHFYHSSNENALLVGQSRLTETDGCLTADGHHHTADHHHNTEDCHHNTEDDQHHTEDDQHSTADHHHHTEDDHHHTEDG